MTSKTFSIVPLTQRDTRLDIASRHNSDDINPVPQSRSQHAPSPQACPHLPSLATPSPRMQASIPDSKSKHRDYVYPNSPLPPSPPKPNLPSNERRRFRARSTRRKKRIQPYLRRSLCRPAERRTERIPGGASRQGGSVAPTRSGVCSGIDTGLGP